MMKHFSQRGFALLYTVIIVSLILTIAISISNISYKQGVLSNLAKDSQLAFYTADAGIECGLYYDVAMGIFPFGTPLASAADTINCGGSQAVLIDSESADDYFYYQLTIPSGDNLPCYTLIFDKLTDPTESSIEARGHNVCAFGPRQVERAIKVTY